LYQVCWNSIRVATGQMKPGPDIQRSIKEFYSALSQGQLPPVSGDEGKGMVAWVEKVAQRADAEKVQQCQISGELKPAPILVTGGSGFLGSALVNALLSGGSRVRILVNRRRLGNLEKHPFVDVVAGNLGDPDVVDRAVRGVQLVYHVGAATSGSWPQNECGTIWGTKNVLDACLRHGVKKLVYVSSLSVLRYAGLPAHALLDESSEVEPFPEQRGHYANSKLQAENLVLQAVRDNALKAVILRPGSIFGPGAEKVPPYGVVQIGNRWIVMGNGKALLPLVYVQDTVDALLQAAESDAAVGQVIQVVDPQQITQREYLRYCGPKMPETRVHYVPMALLYCAAAAMQCLGALARRSVPLTIYRLRSIKSHVEFDCNAARQMLDWKPRFGIPKGLDTMFVKGSIQGDDLATARPTSDPLLTNETIPQKVERV
jgi:nucleoside-diphosphate-sugar epimerase